MSVAAIGPARAELPSLFSDYPWSVLPRLLDRAPSVADLRSHRLELLHAALLRERGLDVSAELAGRARTAQLATVSATALLGRIRGLCSGPLLLLKGPEVAARYPRPGLRPFGDVDLLVPDPTTVQRDLEEAGFVGVGDELDWDELHHMRRVASPDGLFAVEIHKHPKWIPGLEPPPVEILLDGAVPSATGVDGVLAPSPAAHAVLLAAHAWAERPLGCIGDLLDVVTMLRDDAAPREAEELARVLGVERVWHATTVACATLFDGGRSSWPLRTWARHLTATRGQTVVESHLQRVLMPFSAYSPAGAARAAGQGIARTIGPHGEESWAQKLRRARRALRHAFVRRSEHERRLRRGQERE